MVRISKNKYNDTIITANDKTAYNYIHHVYNSNDKVVIKTDKMIQGDIKDFKLVHSQPKLYVYGNNKVRSECPPLSNGTARGIGVSVFLKTESGYKVLLVKSYDKKYLTNVAGYVDINETYAEGAIREVKEETGIDITFDNLIKCGESMMKTKMYDIMIPVEGRAYYVVKEVSSQEVTKLLKWKDDTNEIEYITVVDPDTFTDSYDHQIIQMKFIHSKLTGNKYNVPTVSYMDKFVLY